jgi:hypothetical protein
MCSNERNFWPGENKLSIPTLTQGACMPEQQNSNAARDYINVNEEQDVQYWAEKFECSPESLRIAVARVGVNALDVREHLL